MSNFRLQGESCAEITAVSACNLINPQDIVVFYFRAFSGNPPPHEAELEDGAP
jgi:hypothetical protein